MTALADAFEQHRDHLRRVAQRMLGSTAEADDAVQEAWIKVTRADTTAVENLRGWLTTVVARVCLDMLRSRTSRREDAIEAAPEPSVTPQPLADQELADSVGLALMIVLDRLAPAERLAFVLHDMFAMPFDEIGPIVGRSTAAARQLASRARRRVQGASAPEVDLATQRRLVDAFIAALRAGDVEGMVAVLTREAVVQIDGGDAQVTSARDWASGAVQYAGAAQHMRSVLVDGQVGLALAPGGKLMRVLVFRFTADLIADAEIITDPDALAELTIEELP